MKNKIVFWRCSMFYGKRLKYIRELRGITQKELGIKVGFEDNQADIRISQYEKGHRNPKDPLLVSLADTLEIVPEALKVPNIDSPIGVIHTLFALEDFYQFKVKNIDGTIYISLCGDTDIKQKLLAVNLRLWNRKFEELERGEISKAKYDEWRYNYLPEKNLDSKYCIYCGEEITGAGNYCSNCGKKIERK